MMVYSRETHNTEIYHYMKNSFGDVTDMYSASQNFKGIYGTYAYNAYGEFEILTNSRNAATLNPFRYRGYYYDEDLNLYFVGTRLYDPETGRFVNADISALDIATINGCNLFSCQLFLNSRFQVYNPNGNKKFSVNAANPLFVKRVWPDLSYLSDAFAYAENSFSIISGFIDGFRKVRGLKEFAVLEKVSNVVTWVGIGLNVGLSIYENLTDDSLTDSQKWGNIAGDCIYIAISSGLSYLVAYGVGFIPVVGPFIAPIAAIGISVLWDQLWYGGEILGIEGAIITIDGKSVDRWLKDVLTDLFGG